MQFFIIDEKKEPVDVSQFLNSLAYSFISTIEDMNERDLDYVGGRN